VLWTIVVSKTNVPKASEEEIFC